MRIDSMRTERQQDSLQRKITTVVPLHEDGVLGDINLLHGALPDC